VTGLIGIPLEFTCSFPARYCDVSPQGDDGLVELELARHPDDQAGARFILKIKMTTVLPANLTTDCSDFY
jgi:hypothetical protein